MSGRPIVQTPEATGRAVAPDGTRGIPLGNLPLHHARMGRPTAITFGETRLSWTSLEANANRRARLLAGLGVAQGDLITVALPNSLEFYETTFALWKLGATPNIVSAKLPDHELGAIVSLVDPKLVLGPEPSRLPGRRVLPTGAPVDQALSAESLPEVIAPYWKAMTSGGSTGRPKVIVDHAPGVFDPNTPALLQQVGDVILNAGPLYHNAPFIGAHWGLFAGGHVIEMGRFDALEVLRALSRHKVQWVNLVPTMMNRIWRLPPEERQAADLSNLRVMFHMASSCPPWLKEAFIDWLGPERIFELYGGTERQGATVISGVEWLERRGSVGRVQAGSRVRVQRDDGSPCDPGEVGEIYFLPDAGRNATYHYIGAEPKLSGEWESLGDLGHLDSDGYLYISDRRTDLIVSGGANIYPAEVEAALEAHPEVRSAVVIGRPDEDLGQTVHAIVERAPGSALAQAALLGFVAERLVRYKTPRSLEFVDHPLRDDAGKVRRNAFRTDSKSAPIAQIRYRLGLTFALAWMTGCALTGAAKAETVDRNGVSVSIEAYAPNIVRVTFSTRRADAEAPPGYGVIAQARSSELTHTSGADGDHFRSPRLSVQIAPPLPSWPSPSMDRPLIPPPPVRLKIADADGAILLDMTDWEMGPHTVMGEKTFRIGATFASPDDEHYYGLGQNQEGVLDLRGRTIDCRHDYEAPAGETVCVPFMVTSKGYGIVWDNPSDTHVSPGLNGRTLWQSQVGERVSFFVIVGKTADEIYAGYRLLTGATPIPPKAAFGYIQSKQRYQTQAEVLAAADGYRKRGYPADVMVIDWFYWTKMGQFDMNPAQWPDPAAMNKTLHDQGFQTIISIWPRFERSSRYYDTMAKAGWFMKNPDGSPTYGLPVRFDNFGALIDSTNPAARDFYWSLIRDNFAAKGFDAFWLDETEPDLVPDGSFFSIGSGLRYHNLFPLLHTQGVYEGMRRDRPQQRGLILARAAYLGSQRNGDLFWSSDIFPTWDALKRQVPTGLNFTASGLAYWGNDIGGWIWLPETHKPAHPPLLDPSDARDVVGGDDDYPELFTRWFEYGAFLPTMRVHGSRKEVEIWRYGKAAEPILAKYLKLRYALMPYIYSLGRRTYDTGAPFMRALWMDFPSDPAVATIGDEYMFGPAFLVAPVTDQGATSRPVYLPAGTDWYDWWTGARLRGGQTIQAKAPIDTLPLFVRAGSIVPMGEPVQNTVSVQKLAEVRVFPGADGDFALYSDDGRTYAYETAGGFAITRLHWNDAAGKLEASGDVSPAGDPGRVVQVVGR